MDSFRVDNLSPFTAQFTSTFLKETLEKKDCCTLNMVFCFIAGFIDRASGFVEQIQMTRLYTM